MYTYTFICLFTLIFVEESVGFSLNEFYNDIGYNTLSRITEQCDTRWVTENIEGLADDLHRHVFGQDLAVEAILQALEAHKKNKDRRKPLVLNFYGQTGGGKSFSAGFIIKNWFLKGENSGFVKIYQALIHFPLQEEAQSYQKRLQNELERTIWKCSKSIFLFDEVEKYPSNVLDGIKSYLDYNTKVNGLNFREAIFIFITNSGDDVISNIVLEKLDKGISRNELKISDFDSPLKTFSFDNEGGLFQSDLIKHHLLDHVVPFLPLERKHVKSCIEAELMLREAEFDDFEMITSEIIQELSFGPEDLFCRSGCKYISSKVAGILERKHKSNRMRREL